MSIRILREEWRMWYFSYPFFELLQTKENKSSISAPFIHHYKQNYMKRSIISTHDFPVSLHSNKAPRINLGRPCSVGEFCKDENSECINNICNCKVGFSVENGECGMLPKNSKSFRFAASSSVKE